jgi:hypothetical protein
LWEQENPWALKRYPQIGWSPIPEWDEPYFMKIKGVKMYGSYLII